MLAFALRCISLAGPEFATWEPGTFLTTDAMRTGYYGLLSFFFSVLLACRFLLYDRCCDGFPTGVLINSTPFLFERDGARQAKSSASLLLFPTFWVVWFLIPEFFQRRRIAILGFLILFLLEKKMDSG